MLSDSVSHNHTQNNIIDVVGEVTNQASIPVYVNSPSLQSGVWVKRVSSPMISGALRAHTPRAPCICVIVQHGHMLLTTFTYTY